MRLFPHVTGESAIAAGADGVIAGIPIPGNSTLKHVWIDFSVVAAAIQDVLDASMYAVTAYIVPVLDPDGGVALDTMWDNQIPKDDDVGSDVIDMDTGTADATAEVEPGEPSIEELFNVSARPERIFQRSEMITFGKQSAGFAAGTPNTFIPRDAWKSEIKRHYFVPDPSFLLFGLSAPLMTGTDAGSMVIANNETWLQIRYMADTAKNAWLQAVGLTESGAETPYEEAATVMSAFLERFFEQTSGAMFAQAWRAFVDMRYEIEVEGELSIGSISAGM